MARKSVPAPKRRPQSARVLVSLYLPGGQTSTKGRVSLVRKGRSYALRARQPGLFQGQVEPGAYELRASGEGNLVAPPRPLVVPPEGATASAYLGQKRWPYYRLGDSLVPFEPHPELIAIAFPGRRPPVKIIEEQIKTLCEKLPLRPADARADVKVPHMAANGALWLLRLTGSTADTARRRVSDEARRLFGEDARVGLPVDLAPGRLKVLDDNFVVRFKDAVKPDQIEDLAAKAGARVLRGFIQAGNARLLAFQRGGWRDHLAQIEAWFEAGLIVYGEPDLIAEITDDVFPATPPDDPSYGTQANLTLQNADDAWIYLNGVDPTRTLGSPAVYVMTLDRGVLVGHTDIGGNLTDGTGQLATCYDFVGMQPCSAPGYATDTSHGMGVFGIIAALTNNTTMLAGIAPNTHQIGLKRPDLQSVNYPDILLWAAGFTTGNATPGWPAEPIANPADIISCSHGVDGLALSGLMDDTFKYLSTYGRNGKGTLVIYSAGNASQLITGFRTWAAHPRTMAISNSDQPDGLGVERLNPTSNFGPEIDICAQGNNAPSLSNNGGTQIFGGTSAAAPTVAAAAALMLSVEPALSWVGLRDFLRQTAVQIDPANADPVGQWVGGFSQWYGFGRLDIQAAVQQSDTFDPGDVRLIVRDNLADNGLVVPTGGTFWHSPDLWVRQSDPAVDPIGDPAFGDAPPDEPAAFGADNYVRVRVTNAGTAASSTFYVRAYLTHWAGTEFLYPASFIPSVNAGNPLPSPLVAATYLIGEQTGNNLAAGATQIFNFLWPSALVPPEEVDGVHWHPCLLAEVSPHTGVAPSGNLVIDRSNIAQRNITIAYADDEDDQETIAVIGHEDDDARIKRVVVYRGTIPKRSPIWIRFLDRRVEAAVLKGLADPKDTAPGARPHDMPCCCGGGAGRAPRGRADQVRVDRRRGYRVFRMQGAGPMVIDVPMVSGPLTAIVLGSSLSMGEIAREYECVLGEQDLNGRALGAVALRLVRR